MHVLYMIFNVHTILPNYIFKELFTLIELQLLDNRYPDTLCYVYTKLTKSANVALYCKMRNTICKHILEFF